MWVWQRWILIFWVAVRVLLAWGVRPRSTSMSNSKIASWRSWGCKQKLREQPSFGGQLPVSLRLIQPFLNIKVYFLVQHNIGCQILFETFKPKLQLMFDNRKIKIDSKEITWLLSVPIYSTGCVCARGHFRTLNKNNRLLSVPISNTGCVC